MKPLLALDLETTGLNICTDSIIQVGLYEPFGTQREWWIKPPKPIPAEVEDLTGITNEMVKDCPPFHVVAADIHAALYGADLLVFNGYSFDVPFLFEEFHRAGIEWDLTGVNVIDVGNIYKRKEERTLSAAVKFYLDREHTDAHGALPDCKATYEVFGAMVTHYPIEQVSPFGDRKEIARYSRYDEDRLSFDGKIILKNGVACFNFGKHKEAQTPVINDPSYAQWMLGGEFPEQTKAVIRKVLNEVN